MGLFKSGNEKMLDCVIQRLEMNLSNNYKDNAQDNLKEFDEMLSSMRSSGSLKGKALSKYEDILDSYKTKMKGYTHKDQKPYWH